MKNNICIRYKWTTGRRMVQVRRWNQLLKKEKEHRLKYRYDKYANLDEYFQKDSELSWQKIKLYGIDYNLEHRGLIYILTGYYWTTYV